LEDIVKENDAECARKIETLRLMYRKQGREFSDDELRAIAEKMDERLVIWGGVTRLMLAVVIVLLVIVGLVFHFR
jgi:hypothetical protein